MNTRGCVAGMLIPALALSGCASSSSPVEDLKNQDRISLAALGALGGAAIGAVASKGDAKYIAVGAAAGAGVGYLAGEAVAQRRQKFSDESKFLDSEIKDAEAATKAQEDRLAKLDQQTADIDQSLAKIQADKAAGENVDARERAELHKIQAQIEQNQKTSEGIEKAKSYITEALRTSKESHPELVDQQNRLQAQLDTLASQQTRLAQGTTNLQQRERALAAAGNTSAPSGAH